MIEKYIDKIIKPYEELMGKEYLPYKNHVHRVSILALKLKRNVEKDDELKIAIAAVHHDIGIWTDKTFDYLAPSIEVAKKYLIEHNLETWSKEISLIIDMHHKRSVYKGDFADNVESFRRADLIDVTKGGSSFGIQQAFIKSNFENYPILGFRGLILKRFFKNLITNPFNPLPMLKK